MKKLALVPILAFAFVACADQPNLVAADGFDADLQATMADLLPWGKSSIAAYQAIHAALRDPELEALVHSVDKPAKTLLHRVLSHKDLSREALEAYRDGGAAAAREVLKRGRTGRPPKVVSRRKDGARSAVTVRYWPGMTEGDAAKVLQVLRETVAEVEGMGEQES